MKKITFLSTAIAAVLLVCSPSAKAISPSLNLVTPADTFSFDLVAFNQGSGAAYYIAGPGTATFGLTTTVTGVDGQVITMTSGETVGLSTTTDTFTISTPTNFLTDTTLNGTFINGMQFDVGDLNSGSNPVSLVFPIASYTATGSTIYSLGTAPLTPNSFLATGGASYSFAEGVNSANPANPISAGSFRSFTYSITYATIVPEPSTWAMLGLGIIAGGVMIRRRQLAA